MVPRFSPAQRFVLFQSLYQVSQSGENNWDQVVALLSKGQQAAQRAQLDSVAAQFADGQRFMLDGLREGGVFLDWELQFLQLGLAVGNLAKMYLRLAEHYRLQAEFQQSL
jgi:type II secretory pathway component PulF